jgi:hypothetical protein
LRGSAGGEQGKSWFVETFGPWFGGVWRPAPNVAILQTGRHHRCHHAVFHPAEARGQRAGRVGDFPKLFSSAPLFLDERFFDAGSDEE